MNQKVKLSFFLCMIGIISLTFGTSFSFFDFQNGDSNDNILISGKLAFSYTDFGLGNEINLMDTTPKSDSLGKTQINNGNSFDFKITSNSNKDNPAFYEVTIRKNKNSTLDDKAVKLYLTELDGNWEQEILLDTLSELKQTDKVDKEKYVEKIIYQGQIPANSGYYEKNFRLRIWVDEDYLYSNQDFSAMINVYSNETVVMSANEIKPTQTETVIEEEPLPSNEPIPEESQPSNESISEEPPVLPETVPALEPDSDSIPNQSVESPTLPEVSPSENQSDSQIHMDQSTKTLSFHPIWGEIWATLKIPEIGLEAPIYHGDTADIIEKGIGHYAGSYFPGEGGSVILAAHNSKQHFMYLPNLKVGSQIIIDAVYGTLTYEVTSTKIIADTDTESLPIQHENEILMTYTCYPMGTDEYKVQRYVVYSKLVSEVYY